MNSEAVRSNEEMRLRKSLKQLLRKVKHMQNLLKKEGLSNKTMKENIDTFEDVPAYVRRNMSLGSPIVLQKANCQNSLLLQVIMMNLF